MYVIWDWNGTLLDDTPAALGAQNALLERRGLKTLSLEEYRETFSFPTLKFYEKQGIILTPDISEEFHSVYYSLPSKLNSEAIAAVRYLHEKGVKQSILSALRQDHLEEDVARFFAGAGDSPQFFEHIVGSDNLDGATKFERGLSLLETLKKEGLSPHEIVMIGDALHDKEVADSLGINCLLVSVGGHAHHRLAAVAPTFTSLLDAAKSIKSKSELRSEMKAKRRGLSSAERKNASRAICEKLLSNPEIMEQGPIAVYLATKEEIDLTLFIEEAIRRGASLLAPQWNGKTYDLAPLRSLEVKNLRVGPMGILEPAEPINFSVSTPQPLIPKTWLIPGLAFTSSGSRLGYGGGWYDRFLSEAAPDSLKLGLAYDFQLVPYIPCERHDISLSKIITPN